MTGAVLSGTYDALLVVLSVAIAIAASYTALDLAGWVRASAGWTRAAWLSVAALSMGGGIWSMHFVGMLALRLPLPMAYGPGLTALSLVIAVLATGLGFAVVGRRGGLRRDTMLGGLLMGTGIAAMHYTGMAAMRVPADPHYNGPLVAASVLIAIGAASGALWLAHRGTRLAERLAAAVAMGLAIAGMHYTGMTAITWAPHDATVHGAHDHAGLGQMDLALGVAGATFLILVLALVAAVFDRRSTALAKREAEVALRESEARLRLVIESGGVGIWDWDPATDTTTSSAALNRLYGLPPEAPAPRWEEWLARVHPEDRAHADARAYAGLASGTYADEYRIVRPDGEVRWTVARGVALRDAEGRPTRFLGVNIDVTEQRRADAALRTSEAWLRDLLATLDLGAFLARDLDGTIRVWSAGCQRLYGWTAAEAVGRNAHDLLGTVFPVPRAEIEAALERDGEWSGDLQQRTRDGRDVIVTVRKALRREAEGRPAGVLECAIDVTAQRQAEAALAESEERLRSVVETAVDGILVAGADGRIASANPAAVVMFGYDTAVELIGQELSVLIPAPEAAQHDAHLAAHRARSIGVPGRELVGRRRDGTDFPIELSVAAFRAGGERFFTNIVRDATERVQVERRRELLVRELNHRVKNTLATVQSVAVQTLRGAAGDVARFAHDFGSRLQALAAAHDLLTAHSWEATDLAAVVRAALAPWMGGDGQRIGLTGPEGAVRLRPLQAQAMVLALHELATNAVKHGALSRAGGRVELRWTEPRPDGAVLVEWEETGGPRLAGPPARRGFGTRLLERAIAQDLGPGARVALRFEPEGLRASLQFFPPPPAAGRRLASGIK